MSTERRPRKLALEILGLIGVSGAFTAMLFVILTGTAAAIAENYCFYNDIPMTEFDWLEVDRWIFTGGGVICAIAFSVLFLTLLSDRMAYIRAITAGIRDLGRAELPLEGRNELTELARAINDLAAAQRRLREREQALAREKEQFLRTLSHDIRTPLTAVLAYSEYLAADNGLTEGERREYLGTIRRKAEQIRDLTALLLDGDKRSPERFDNARLLMEQLAAEFEEILEDRFEIRTDLRACPAFSGVFDLGELRRIFDNLASNVEKYADPACPVELAIGADAGGLYIRQSNAVLSNADRRDSYKLGVHSIRRVAQNYGGRVEVAEDAGRFRIVITLSDFL